MEAAALFEHLRAFAVSQKNARFELAAYLQARMREGEAALPGTRQALEMTAALQELERKGKCSLSYERNSVKTVTVTHFAEMLLASEYRAVLADGHHPFPREETMGTAVPEPDVLSLDVRKDYVTALASPEPPDRPICKILFPEGIVALLAPSDIIGTRLIEAAVARIGLYLQDTKNGAYALNKLNGLLKGNDSALKQTLDALIQQTPKAAESALSPDEFTFRFWTHLGNIILQDFRKKKEKTAEDQACCQSAYLIGYYIFHQKGRLARAQERDSDRRRLDAAVRKPPYVYSFEDLYGLRDLQGVPLTRKYDRQFIASFIEEKTRAEDPGSLPALVNVKCGAKEYFIHRDLLIPVFLKQLSDAAPELRKVYLDEWEAKLRSNDADQPMRDDRAFSRDMEIRIKEDWPLLAALSNAAILFLAREGKELPAEAAREIDRCFAKPDTLKPYPELLGLDRSTLLKIASAALPFWQTTPVLRQLVLFFIRLIAGGHRRDRDGQAAKPQRAAARAAEVRMQEADPQEEAPIAKDEKSKDALLARYKKAIQSLKESYVPQGGNMEGTLSVLAEKWNPLFDPKAKANLTEDVNALVRDYLRALKRGLILQPPDAERIRNLAADLAGNKHLESIKKKDQLRRYIELYMIKSLQLR